jgi:ribulose-phosphate 3-epimerase
VLVMTVNPGFGGQRFISEALPKIGRIRALAAERGLPPIPVQVDGGVDPHTAPDAARAGAGILVAGSSVFRGPDGIGASYDALRAALAVHV